MIELLKDFPDNVTAIVLHGQVTKTDYDTVLIPDLEGKLGRHKKIRLYCEIAPDYVGIDPGAAATAVVAADVLGLSQHRFWHYCGDGCAFDAGAQ